MLRTSLKITVGLLLLLGVEKAMALQLLSPAFQPGETIPSQYTCDGKNSSPPLIWKEAPANTKSFVLIMDDPDAPAGTWDHWILYNLPANTTTLPETLQQLPEGTLVGKNSWSKTNYGGPCPPNGEHRYFFKLYALDTTLPAQSGMTKQAIEAAMQGHVLAQAELIAKYQRTK